MTKHCKYCGGGTLDLEAHEKNCVMRPRQGPKAGVECECGSRNTVFTGNGVSQDADASRGLPMIEGDEVTCNDCGRTFWY